MCVSILTRPYESLVITCCAECGDSGCSTHNASLAIGDKGATFGML